MKKIVLFAMVGFLISSCSSIKVVTDYDKSVDFSQYKTLEYYGWAENSDQILSRFDKERIENAFGNEFEKRGFSMAEKGQGDIIVSLYIITEQKVQRSANTTQMGGAYGGYGSFYGYGPNYGWGGGHSTTTFSEYEYTVGTLVVSVFDAEKKVLIWEAAGAGTVDEDPNTRDKSIPKAVEKIMSEYPVKPISDS